MEVDCKGEVVSSLAEMHNLEESEQWTQGDVEDSGGKVQRQKEQLPTYSLKNLL